MLDLESFIPLGNVPTPIEDNASFNSLHSSSLHLKRDDCLDTLIGGTKLRALGYILKDAIEQKATDLITVGEFNSNQCRIIAHLGNRYGLKVHLLLRGRPPQNPDEVDINFLLTNLFYPNIVFLNEEEWRFHLLSVERLKHRLRSEKRTPYFIPFGCVGWPGPLGIVNLMKELYVQNNCEIPFSHIVVPTGSGGTLFGMDVAFQVLPELSVVEPPQLMGVSLHEDAPRLEHRIDEYYKTFQLKTGIDVKRSSTLSIYPAEGTLAGGEVSPKMLDIADKYGLVLDPVYLVQPFCTMINFVQEGVIPKHSNILFMITGHNFNLSSIKEELYNEVLKRG